MKPDHKYTSGNKVKAWNLIRSEDGPSMPLFKVEFQYLENPRNQARLKALVLHAGDTVNVVALTKEKELLLVEQYRFGIGKSLCELPAGFIDLNESSLDAAKRELREETGFVSHHWKYIGFSYINPSYVTNRCFHYLCLEAESKADVDPDLTEDLRLIKIPHPEIDGFLRKGGIRDAIGKATIIDALQMNDYVFKEIE